MSTIRKARLSPSYTQIDTPSKTRLIHAEIKKFKPRVEVTRSGGSEIATGRIVEWFPQRHFFTVEWDKISAAFREQAFDGSVSNLYFKARLFSTLLVFKSTPVRKGDQRFSDYRLPTSLYQQQSRGALRVPLPSGAGTLSTERGDFEIKDLSVAGARIANLKPTRRAFKVGAEISPVLLQLGKLRIPDLKIVITTATGGSYGCRFVGMSQEHRTHIKQYLVDALRKFYEEPRTKGP